MLGLVISANLLVTIVPHASGDVREMVGMSAAVLLPPGAGDRLPGAVLLTVPFVPQAPGGDWSDIRRSEGCEEASVLMAQWWVDGSTVGSDAEVGAAIDSLAGDAALRFGTSVDSSAADTATLLEMHVDPPLVRVEYDVNIIDLRRELAAGNLLIVPVDGTVLANPHYRTPGPPRHMVVVRGYDDVRGEVTTNDPGTQAGERTRYSYATFARAMRDYQTGEYQQVLERRTAMVVVTRRGTGGTP